MFISQGNILYADLADTTDTADTAYTDEYLFRWAKHHFAIQIKELRG